jgi:hypothetical protein
MDLMLLRVFQRQVAFQCEAVIFAAEDLQQALSIGASSRAWVAIENLLGAAANLSKALWGQGGDLRASGNRCVQTCTSTIRRLFEK